MSLSVSSSLSKLLSYLRFAPVSLAIIGGVSTSSPASPWEEVSFAPYMDIPIVSLEFKEPIEDAKSISYEPNVAPEAGLSLSYSDYSFRIGTPVSAPDVTKGTTRHFDYSFAIDRDHWSLDVGVQRYEGFYIVDEDVDYDEDTVYDQDSTLAKEARFLNLFVFPFSDHVNFAKNSQTADIDKRAWSPVLHVGYELTSLSSSETLFAARGVALTASDRGLSAARFESYIGSAGLAGSAMVSKMRMVGLLLFGSGKQHRILDEEDTSRSGWDHTERFSLRGRMEFEKNEWLFAVKMNLDQTNLRMHDTKITSDTGVIGLSVATKIGSFLSRL